MYESAKKLAKDKFNTIIVDNGSTKEEYEKLLKYNFEDTKIVRSENNLGFAAGNNLALENICSDCYIVFINSDIIISEQNWDEKYKETLDIDNVGVVGCAYHPLYWSRDGRFKILPLSDSIVESESVQGAFFGIKKVLLDVMKDNDGCYFDENFRFAHYEETDLCFRIMKFAKCMWMPLKHIHDHHHSSTKKNGFKLNSEIQNEQQFKANSERNRQLLLRKHAEWFASK